MEIVYQLIVTSIYDLNSEGLLFKNLVCTTYLVPCPTNSMPLSADFLIQTYLVTFQVTSFVKIFPGTVHGWTVRYDDKMLSKVPKRLMKTC